MSSPRRRRAPLRRSRRAAARRSPRAMLAAGARAAAGGRTAPTPAGRSTWSRRQAGRAAAARRRSRSATPKTARRITSSVIACMLGWTANARALRPRGELPLAPPRASRPRRRACARRGTAAASPCRRARCSSPSSSSSDRAPTSGCSVTVRPGGSACPRSPYSARIDVGPRDHHQRRPEALEHHAERVAVAAPAVLEEADRPRQPARGLQDRRLGGSGGEGGHTSNVPGRRPGGVANSPPAGAARTARGGMRAGGTPASRLRTAASEWEGSHCHEPLADPTAARQRTPGRAHSPLPQGPLTPSRHDHPRHHRPPPPRLPRLRGPGRPRAGPAPARDGRLRLVTGRLRSVRLLLVRVGLPAVTALAGVVLLIVGGDAATGAGIVLIGVAGLIVLANVLIRLGLQSQDDRDREEARRRFLSEHGRWPRRDEL